VFVKETNKFKLDAVKQHESSKPHQYYQSRYNHTSQTQLNLFISVVDLNLGQNCLDMGGLVKIPLEQVPLSGKLKSLLGRLLTLKNNGRRPNNTQINPLCMKDSSGRMSHC
jgi:hypothetical protein